MSYRLNSQLERLTSDEFSGIIMGAMGVACADGTLEEAEVSEMLDSLMQLTENKFDRDEVYELLNTAYEMVNNEGVASAIGSAASVLSGDAEMAEVAVVVASAIGWAGRGINAAEGVQIRSLSDQLGIDEHTYFQLLAEGKTIVGR